MRRVMLVTCLGVLWACLLAVSPMAAQQTTQEVTIDKGTVLKVMGNTIIVRHDTGDVKKYTRTVQRKVQVPRRQSYGQSVARGQQVDADDNPRHLDRFGQRGRDEDHRAHRRDGAGRTATGRETGPGRGPCAPAPPPRSRRRRSRPSARHPRRPHPPRRDSRRPPARCRWPASRACCCSPAASRCAVASDSRERPSTEPALGPWTVVPGM